MLHILIEPLITLRALLSEHVLFTVGAMLLMGYCIGILARYVKLPEITGFILAGVMLGDSMLGIVPLQVAGSMKMITEIALGLIALTIGSEFSLSKLKRMGSPVLWISLFQLVGTFVIVLGAMVLAGLALPFAMILAAIATTSSPAVVVAMVQSLRAKGFFVDCLYGTVALLDAGAVILFGICFSLAAGMLGWAGGEESASSLFWSALGEVVLSLAAGLVMGSILHMSIARKNHPNEILLIVLGIVCMATAIAIVFHLSPLLMNMTAGAVLTNVSARHHRIFRLLEPLTPPLYALFFVLAGSELQLSILMRPTVLLLGFVFICSRNLAKWGTTYLGGRFTQCAVPIRLNLGLCMFPQAGVALGLVLLIQASPLAANMTDVQAQVVETLVNVVLLSVFINQLLGPPLAKGAIIRGNEMEEDE